MRDERRMKRMMLMWRVLVFRLAMHRSFVQECALFFILKPQVHVGTWMKSLDF
jgi:hypothetical protein